MLTSFTSSDNAPHICFTMVAVRIDQLLCTARPGKHIRPTLDQILFQTINIKEPRMTMIDDNTQKTPHRKKKKNFSRTNIYTIPTWNLLPVHTTYRPYPKLYRRVCASTIPWSSKVYQNHFSEIMRDLAPISLPTCFIYLVRLYH